MEENTNKTDYDGGQEEFITDDSPKDVANPSRRWLLKALTAGGVAAAASFVPKKWSTPVVEGGVLPAHAQLSPMLLLLDCFGGGTITIQPGQDMVVLSFSVMENLASINNIVIVAALNTITPQIYQAVTNQNGQAFFNDIEVPLSNISDDYLEAMVYFQDQDAYGSAICRSVWRLQYS